jgi:hypothetical protein
MVKLLLLLFVGPLGLPSLYSQEVKPIKTYKGIIYIPRSFSLDGAKPKKESPLIVVQNAKEYERFLKRIPIKQISRTRPAPPNTDPLVKKPEIDFKKHTLIAVSRSSMAKPIIRSVKVDGKKVTVDVSFPKEFPAAHPVDIGTYTAVLVPKTEGMMHLVRIIKDRK